MPTELRLRTCKNCRRTFNHVREVGKAGRPPSHCSKECQLAYYKKNREAKAAATAAPPRKLRGQRTSTCKTCGFDFEYEVHGSYQNKYCSDVCRAAAERQRRVAGLDPETERTAHLAREITTLRVAVEIARARLAMGIHGSMCGRDTVSAGRLEALAELDNAIEAHDVLAATRSEWSKLKLPPAGVKIIDLTERQDTAETMAS